MNTCMRIGLCALFAAGTLSSFSAAEQEGTELIRIASGTKGGVYDELSTAIVRLVLRMGYDAEATATSGAIENVEFLADRKVYIAFAPNDIADYAFIGKEGFRKRYRSLRGIAALYPEVVQIVVRRDSEIRSVNDLVVERKVSVGPSGGSTEYNARHILGIHRLDLNDIDVSRDGFTAAVRKLGNSELSAAFVTAGIPTPALTTPTANLKLLSIDENHIPRLQRLWPVYFEYTIGRREYKWLTEDVRTVAVRALLVTREDADDGFINEFTTHLFSSEGIRLLQEAHAGIAQDIRPESSLAGMSIPLHPGARRFFEEKGILLRERAPIAPETVDRAFDRLRDGVQPFLPYVSFLMSCLAGAFLFLLLLLLIACRRRSLVWPRRGRAVEWLDRNCRKCTLLLSILATASVIVIATRVLVHFNPGNVVGRSLGFLAPRMIFAIPFLVALCLILWWIPGFDWLRRCRIIYALAWPFRRSKLLLTVLVILSVLLVQASLILYLESRYAKQQPGIRTQAYYDAWKTLLWTVFAYSHLDVEHYPKSPGGRFAAATLSIAVRLTILTAAVGLLYAQLRKPRAPRNPNHHFVICNWNERGETIVKELIKGSPIPRPEIYVITEKHIDDETREDYQRKGVYFIPQKDPRSHAALQEAGAHRATGAIVLADGHCRNPDDKTALICLAIKRLTESLPAGTKPPEKPYIVAEAHNPARKENLIDAGAREVVCCGEYSLGIVAQCILRPELRLSDVYHSLLTIEPQSNELYLVYPSKYPKQWLDKSFKDVSKIISDRGDCPNPCILLGMIKNDEVLVNPRDRGSLVKEGDVLIVMAYEQPDLRKGLRSGC